jgi:cysteine-rich repeat protein
MPRKPIRPPADEAELMESLLRKKFEGAVPRAEFHDELFGRLVRARIAAQGEEATAASHGLRLGIMHRFFSTSVAAIIIVVATAGFTTGYAYISPDVNRSSSLYFLKRTAERLELMLAFSPESRAQTYLKFSERRAEEASTLVKQGEVDQTTLEEVVSNAEQAHAIAQGIEDGETRASLSSLVEEASQRSRQELLNIVAAYESPAEPNPPSESTIPVTELTEPTSDEPGIAREEPSLVPPPSPSAPKVAVLEKAISDMGQVEMKALSAAQPSLSQAPGVASRQFLPDLSIIIAGSKEIRRGQQYDLEVRVENVGFGSAPMSQIVLNWGDGNTSEKLSLGALSQGAGDKRKLSHVFRSTGVYVVRAEVNPGAAFSERTDANNRITMVVSVTDPSANDCPGPDSKRCDSNQLQDCIPSGADGSYVWHVQETCGQDEKCTLSGCEPIVTCESDCAFAGARRCNGDAIELCVMDNASCLHWTASTSCGANGQLCKDGSCFSPQCGNGNLEGTERCDDGNTENGDGCDALCRVEKCSDTDGGQYPAVAGTVNYGYMGTLTDTDTCISADTLLEQYCFNSGRRTYTIQCPNGCANSACRQTPVSTPKCGNGIKEDGEQCDDGNLVNGDGCSSTCQITCKDSDGGQVPEKQGTTSMIGGSGTDYCRDSSTLIEYYCAGDFILSSTAIPCQGGCTNGVCALAPAVVCGNGKVESGEQCDDGNTTNGDGCSSTCRIEPLSCAVLKTQAYISVTNGTVTAYDKDYDLYVCTAGNDTPVTVEPKYAGVNYPAIAGDNLVYFKSYGIYLYNVSTKVKIELEPVSSGSNSPVIAGKYIAYFKNYGIVLYNIESRQKTQIEPANSGCYNPKINATTLTYLCNGVTKTHYIESLCGNGKVESAEQCDDGNTTSGDGCSATCQTEAPAPDAKAFLYVDTNGDKSIAMSEAADGYVRFGKAFGTSTNSADFDANGLVDLGDFSYFAKVLSGNQPVIRAFKYVDSSGDMKVTDAEAAAAAVRIDADVRSGNIAADFNADGVANLSDLGIFNVVMGPVGYKIVCGNGLVDLFEECDDGNTMSGDGCSSSCKKEAVSIDLSQSAVKVSPIPAVCGSKISFTHSIIAPAGTSPSGVLLRIAIPSASDGTTLQFSKADSYSTCTALTDLGEVQCTGAPVSTPIILTFLVPVTAKDKAVFGYHSLVSASQNDPIAENNVADIGWIDISCPQ